MTSGFASIRGLYRLVRYRPRLFFWCRPTPLRGVFRSLIIGHAAGDYKPENSVREKMVVGEYNGRKMSTNGLSFKENQEWTISDNHDGISSERRAWGLRRCLWAVGRRPLLPANARTGLISSLLWPTIAAGTGSADTAARRTAHRSWTSSPPEACGLRLSGSLLSARRQDICC